MLKGYDRVEAASFILNRLYPGDYRMFPPERLPKLLLQCIDADFAYMRMDNIMQADGSDGECYYNNDNAFRHIVMTLLKSNRLTEEYVEDICALVDDYMDFNRSYLEKKRLKYHTDERLLVERFGW